MEFTKSQIAGLVLGYLRNEKCFEAFDAFLEFSEYFQGHRQNIKIGKYFVTRVGGMSLLDFLEEYANIYSIVEGRLEASNYYSEHERRHTLSEKLLYLLDAQEEVEVSTPERSITNVDKNSDVSRVLTQTLLENHEFHEKIAETINIVRSTPEMVKTSEEQISAGAEEELDALVQTVVQKTQEDPMYHKLIDEIIGTATAMDKKQNACNVPEGFSQNTISTNTDLSTTRPKRNSQKFDKSLTSSVIEEHNNDAIQSIIAAAQNPCQNVQHPNNSAVNKPECSNEVYVFDGTLDSLLKNTAVSDTSATNPLYVNTGSLIMMPQEPAAKQYYLVNNQPLINGSVPPVKNVLTDVDIMAMPTIIVNDTVQSTFPIEPPPQGTQPKKLINILPKSKVLESPGVNEFLNFNKTQHPEKPKVKTNRTDSCMTISNTVVVTASKTILSTVAPSTSKSSSRHVRNLDFSSPTKSGTEQKKPPVKDGKSENFSTWDADLRSIIGNCTNSIKSVPIRKRPPTSKVKKKKVKKGSDDTLDEPEKIKTEELKTENDTSAPVEDDVPSNKEGTEKVDVAGEHLQKTPPDKEKQLSTPEKNIIPKTPGIGSFTKSLYCTPFSENLEEQLLKGVDLISLPTPKIPITPCLNLASTSAVYNNRSTDYSTSSSYYQPSDTEHNKSVEQLIEECREKENQEKCSESKDNFENLKILSEVVSEQSKTETANVTVTKKKKGCESTLKNFNKNVIGKKNLNLLPRHSSSSSSSDESDTLSENDSEKSEEKSNNTVIEKVSPVIAETVAVANLNSINDIINTVQIKNTLQEAKDRTSSLQEEKDKQKKSLLAHLEKVRRRTVNNLKNEETKKGTRAEPKQTKNRVRKKTDTSAKAKLRNSKKNDAPPEDSNTDEESQKLVKNLWQRQIHLIPNKSPTKINTKNVSENETVKLTESTNEEAEKAPRVKGNIKNDPIFNKRICDDVIGIIYNEEQTCSRRSLKDYNFELLKKRLTVNVLSEHLNKTVDIIMSTTHFGSLIDFPSKVNVLIPKKVKRSEEIDNDLMDFVFVASSKKDDSLESKSSKGGRKRKSRLNDEEKQAKKRYKVDNKKNKILKKVNVETFLCKVYK